MDAHTCLAAHPALHSAHTAGDNEFHIGTVGRFGDHFWGNTEVERIKLLITGQSHNSVRIANINAKRRAFVTQPLSVNLRVEATLRTKAPRAHTHRVAPAAACLHGTQPTPRSKGHAAAKVEARFCLKERSKDACTVSAHF